MDTLPSRYLLGRDIQRYRSLKDSVKKLQKDHDETLVAIRETHDSLVALNLGRENAVDNVGYENGVRLGDRKVLDDLYAKQEMLDARAIKQRKKLSTEQEKLYRAAKSGALNELLAQVVSPGKASDDEGDTKVNTKPEHKKSTTRRPLQDDERLVDDSKHHTLGYTTEITVGRYPPSCQPSRASSVRRHPSVWTNCEQRSCSQPAHLQPSSTQKRPLSQGSNIHPHPSKRPCARQTPIPKPDLHREVSFEDTVSTHSASTLVDSQSSEPRPPSRPFPRTMRRSAVGTHHKSTLARQLSYVPGQQDHISPKQIDAPPNLAPKHCDCYKKQKAASTPEKADLPEMDSKINTQQHAREVRKPEAVEAPDASATHHGAHAPFLYSFGKAVFTLFGSAYVFSSIWKAATYTPPPPSSMPHKTCTTTVSEQRPPLNGIFRELGNFVFLLFGLTTILGVLRSRTG